MKDGRFLALEGVRGVSAVVVVLFHFICMFYPLITAGSGFENRLGIEGYIFGTPAFSLVSGLLAVAVFFVLSGFVLSIRFFVKGREESIRNQAARRYLRLMLPALASVVVAFVLLVLGLGMNMKAPDFETYAAIEGTGYWKVDPNIIKAFLEGTVGIFTQPRSAYNSVLWTMYYEFIGSLMIFGFLLLFGKQRNRWLVYLFLIVLTSGTFYLAFVLGVILADAYAHRKVPSFSGLRGIGLLAIGMVVGGVSASIEPGSFYSYFPTVFSNDGRQMAFLQTIGAFLIIAAVLCTPLLRKVFEHKWLSGLGKYTFSLYLTHRLILGSFTASIFIVLQSLMGYNKAALLAFILSIPLFVGASFMFEKWVDAPSTRVAKTFAGWLLASNAATKDTVTRQHAHKNQLL